MKLIRKKQFKSDISYVKVWSFKIAILLFEERAIFDFL